MKKILYIIGCAMVAFTGCEKAIDVDVPFESPRLVLNGFMNPDSSFSAHISKSQFVLDRADLKNISDATVRIYEGENLLGEMEHQEEGLYMLPDLFPESGKTYTIQAEKQGFASVNAKEKVLNPLNISDFKYDTTGVEEFGEVKVAYEFTLHDPVGEKNYYLLRLTEKGIRKTYNGQNSETGEPEWKWLPYVHLLSTESADPLMESYCVGFSGCGFFLKDDFLDGKDYRIKLTSRSFKSPHDRDNYKDVSYYFAIYQISESYYRYLKTLDQNQGIRDNPFAEPAKVYSNVEGGYGIWSSLTLTTIKLGE